MEGRVGLCTLEMRVDMHICLHLKWSLRLSDVKKKTQVAVRILVKSPNTRFNDDLFSGFLIALGLRTDRRRNVHRKHKRMETHLKREKIKGREHTKYKIKEGRKIIVRFGLGN